jgi:hypothetical protein
MSHYVLRRAWLTSKFYILQIFKRMFAPGFVLQRPALYPDVWPTLKPS